MCQLSGGCLQVPTQFAHACAAFNVFVGQFGCCSSNRVVVDWFVSALYGQRILSGLVLQLAGECLRLGVQRGVWLLLCTGAACTC